jgi:hypothetical protein
MRLACGEKDPSPAWKAEEDTATARTSLRRAIRSGRRDGRNSLYAAPSAQVAAGQTRIVVGEVTSASP